MSKQSDTGDIAKLLEIMARLRDKRHGCPWDLEQTFRSIAPYTIEEAYEVIDAIERDDLTELAVELGDLLLQVVFHARIAEEAGVFSFADVTRHICDKMVRRHPHVFGDAQVADAAAQTEAWEALKRQEKSPDAEASLLDDVPLGLPALTRAVKIGRRAARVGFDWLDARGPRAKVDEELAELDRELVMLDIALHDQRDRNEAAAAAAKKRVEAELGDVFMALASLCRHLDVDPEQCLRGANRRFDGRFRQVEQAVRASGRAFADHTPDELDAHWRRAKAGGRQSDEEGFQ